MESQDAEYILTMSSDGVAAFIREQADARRLSPLVRKLNRDLMGGDPTARSMAARALKHMGFVDSP